MKAFCIFGKMFSWLTHYCPHSLITSLKQFYSHDLAMPQKKLRHLRRLHDKFWGTLGSLEKLWAQFFLRSGVGIIQLFYSIVCAIWKWHHSSNNMTSYSIFMFIQSRDPSTDEILEFFWVTLQSIKKCEGTLIEALQRNMTKIWIQSDWH